MTGPKINLDDLLSGSSSQQEVQDLDIDSLIGSNTEEIGGFTKAGKTLVGAGKSAIENAVLAIHALADPNPDSEKRKQYVEKVKNNFTRLSQSAPVLGQDLLNFFDTFSKKQLDHVISQAGLGVDPSDSTSDILLKPFKLTGKAVAPLGKFSTYGNIASGVVDMYVRPMEVLVGEDFSQDNRPLTPEETAKRAKTVLGDAIMIVGTGVVSGALSRKLAGEGIETAIKKNLTDLTNKELLNAAAGPKVGAIGRKVIANTTGGAVGGFTGGLVSASGEEDALNQALLMGVMGVPLGFAQEFAVGAVRRMRGKVLDTPEMVSEVAKSIFDERQVKLYADDSMEKALNKLEALKTSDDLGEAAQKLGTIAIGEDIPLSFRYDNFLRYKDEIDYIDSLIAEEKRLIKQKASDYDDLDIDPALELSRGPDLGFASKRGAQESIKKLEAKKQELIEERDALAKIPHRHVFNVEKFKENFYDEFSHSAYPASKILDAEPVDGFNFDKHLYDFAKSKGIPEEYVPALRNDIIERLKKEVYNDLEPDERYALDRLTQDLQKAEEKLANDYVDIGARVGRKAQEQGMYVDKNPDGSLILRERETGLEVAMMRSDDLLDQFAKDAGRPLNGLKLSDVGTGVPSGATPIPPTPPPPIKSPAFGAAFSPPVSSFGKLWDMINVSKFGSGFTAVKDVMTSLDNLNKTEFLAKIWDTTQPAYRRAVSKLIPHHKELHSISQSGRNLTAVQWRQISQYRQSRTAKELVDRFVTTKGKVRGVSALEQSHGKWLADNNVDIGKVFAFRRRMQELEGQGLNAVDFDNARKTLEVDMGMDSVHLDAYTRFQTILQGSRQNSDLGAVVAYATALKSGISKKDYAFKNKMTAQQIKIAERLDRYYQNLADEFGIENRLEDYMNHYQKYGEFPQFQKLADRTEQFLSELPRTNEIANYEDHPIVAAMRYTTAGVKVKEFYPVWNQAKKAAKQELDKIADPKKRETARMQIEDYLEGIVGNRQLITESTVKYIEEVWKLRNPKVSTETVKEAARRWMSNYFAITEASAQGFRPSQGLRDFYGVVNNHYLRFGSKRSARAMALFAKMTPDEKRALEMSGEVPTLQPYEVVIPGEASAEWRGQLAKGAEVLSNLSFAGSMQKTAYRNGHFMVYNETFINTSEVLSKLHDGKYGTVDPVAAKAKAYRDLDLQTYDPSIQYQFDKLVQEGKIVEAKQFLSRITAAEAVFAYGAANQPRYFSSLPGALAGQWGVWSLWESRYLTRLASRGTVRDRLRTLARFGASYSSIRAADGLTGLNLASWFLTPSALLGRMGPVPQTAYSIVDSMSPNERVSDMAIDDLQRKATLAVPGYQAVRGWLQAYDLWNRGFDPATSIVRGLGISVDEINQNWWDVLLRDTGGFEQGRETIPNQVMGAGTTKKVLKRETKATNQN